RNAMRDVKSDPHYCGADGRRFHRIAQIELEPHCMPPSCRNLMIHDTREYRLGIGRSTVRCGTQCMRPDWWKLPPMTRADQWREPGAIIRSHDPQCGGILMLGLDWGSDGLKDGFAAAAPEPLVKGFAVGRFIFWSTAEDWFAGHITDGEAVIRMSERYRQV